MTHRHSNVITAHYCRPTTTN